MEKLPVALRPSARATRGAWWHATDSLLLVAGVENLTDKGYREHLDFRDFLKDIEVRRPGGSFCTSVELRD